MCPAARKFLIAQGRNAEDVDALPVVQVGLLYAVSLYEERYDELRKWQGVPYARARAALVKIEKEIGAHRAEDVNFATVFADLMLPAVQKVLLASQRTDRQTAGLRCVEAIRLYAAANDGRLPATLDDIHDAPIPLDPITGDAFTYKRDGGKAYLSAPRPPGETAHEGNTLRYEITLRAR